MKQLRIHWKLCNGLLTQKKGSRHRQKHSLCQRKHKRKPWIQQGIHKNSTTPVPGKALPEAQEADISSVEKSDQNDSLYWKRPRLHTRKIAKCAKYVISESFCEKKCLKLADSDSRHGISEGRRQLPIEKPTSKKTFTMTQVSHKTYHFTQNDSQPRRGATNTCAG